MGKTLGLDLGTNSIGWAVVNEEEQKIVDCGVFLFQEGVKIEKGKEGSKAAERTRFRSGRRLRFRRRLRKIETLKVLIEYGMCPLTREELLQWRKDKKSYPSNLEFQGWLRTEDKVDYNPYALRAKAVEEKLSNLDLGRAFYHIAQRRGFKSNRLENKSGKESGVVTEGINELTKQMEERNKKTLGQLFYEFYKNNQNNASEKMKIRKNYTSREKHYLAEFNKICEVQELSKKIISDLEKAIFYQRPLKSQKGVVGKCTLEPNKPRCPMSHYLFEKFRMLSFINSIRYRDEQGRMFPLLEEHRNAVEHLFFRKSKSNFDFSDIGKELKKKYRLNEFNYKDYQNVSGSPTSTALMNLFGKNWENWEKEYTREKDGKVSCLTIDDIWHALFFFPDSDKLYEWAKNKLKLEEEKAKEFSKIYLKQGYANLSLCAIRKILPYLERGLLYSHAAYLANLEKVIPKEKKKYLSEMEKDITFIINHYEEQGKIRDLVNSFLKKYYEDNRKEITECEIRMAVKKRFLNYCEEDARDLSDTAIRNFQAYIQRADRSYMKVPRLDNEIKQCLENKYDIPKSYLGKLYHPSDITEFKGAVRKKGEKLYLSSPRTNSIRNPMAMRTLFSMKRLINVLIDKGKIDENCTVQIELARELNDKNMRVALKRYQRENTKKHEEYKKVIGETLNRPVTDTDILKYQLWEEQNHICLYTGEQINLVDFLGDNPKYDIEHTIPRSVSFDDSQTNKTLCQNHYNREIKKNLIPKDCPNYEEISKRLDDWRSLADFHKRQIEKAKKSAKQASTKEEKDQYIQNVHYYKLYYSYWKTKLSYFEIKETPEGFTHRQLTDTGIITKYARLYLKTVFPKVYTVKGVMTDKFKRLWGILEGNEIKSREVHTHHMIDAVVIACIKPKCNGELSAYYRNEEEGSRPFIPKPWVHFREDVKMAENDVLVKHHTSDHLLKQTKIKMRKRGNIQYARMEKNGEYIVDPETGKKKTLYRQGKTARGSLHLDTFYGAIQNIHDDKTVIKYVLRIPLNNEQKFNKMEDFDKIVDFAVREKVKSTISERMNNGMSFKEAINSSPIWMNKDKYIPIKSVRCYDRVKTPLQLKSHSSLSRLQHKQKYLVHNDENYAIAIYEEATGENRKRDFDVFCNLKIAKEGKFSVERIKDGKRLKWLLKKGMMVLLYKDSPEELRNIPYEILSKRLYKIIGLYTDDGRILLLHHAEGRAVGKLKEKKGEYLPDREYTPIWNFMYKQFNALIEGQDFIISDDGKITFSDEKKLC